MTLPEYLSAFAVLLIVCTFGVWVLWRKWQRHRLRGSSRVRVLRGWEQAMRRQDAFRMLMEADAVLDTLLTELGYAGTLGEKLKKAGPYLPDLDAVWKAHKLRNRLAHEVGTPVPERELREALGTLEKTIRHFCG
ncbi:MAG: hypothetical protein WCV62_06190 [Candidatus Peribacteraceae bacterium]|jgi:hypothetical protein